MIKNFEKYPKKVPLVQILPLRCLVLRVLHVRGCPIINFRAAQEKNGSGFEDLLAADIASIPAREDRQ